MSGFPRGRKLRTAQLNRDAAAGKKRRSVRIIGLLRIGSRELVLEVGSLVPGLVARRRKGAAAC
jgi:hypothetical protein